MIRFAASVATAAVLIPSPILAHGFAGDRFFPATIATDDPFVADEASFPTLSTEHNATTATNPGSQQYDFETDISKRITPNVGVTISDAYHYFDNRGQNATFGLDNLVTELQYQFYTNGPHEFILSTGIKTNWGDTGTQRIGSADFTTVSPLLDFGKGLGDLPDSLGFIRPFAITGNLSVDFPTRLQTDGVNHPNNFNSGFALEYSLEYLQHHVKDVGLGAPFDRMIPLVEFTYSTPLNRGLAGQTTGTISPGLIWAGQYYQIGAELNIPANSRSGQNVGFLVQLHFFLDDIFPNSIGRPLFRY
ncbi:MAG TPA: hypothetical protein VKT70_02030 [Stellaceae bacterium]|nr:hypothetical protein [Stellaceae bacterium]